MYSWTTNGTDEDLAILALPAAAQDALLALLEALVFDPHDYGRTPDEPQDKAVRKFAFGDAGHVVVTILDRDRLVVVVQVAWAG